MNFTDLAASTHVPTPVAAVVRSAPQETTRAPEGKREADLRTWLPNRDPSTSVAVGARAGLASRNIQNKSHIVIIIKRKMQIFKEFKVW